MLDVRYFKDPFVENFLLDIYFVGMFDAKDYFVQHCN